MIKKVIDNLIEVYLLFCHLAVFNCVIMYIFNYRQIFYKSLFYLEIKITICQTRVHPNLLLEASSKELCRKKSMKKMKLFMSKREGCSEKLNK